MTKNNGKAKLSPSIENVDQANAASNPDAYKTFDIKKAVEQDLRAAVSLLHLVLDNPQILDLVIAEIEKIRARVIEQESLPKREDFHPELTPSA